MKLRPELATETLLLLPLEETDFEPLYEAASDPGIWEQHPNKNRWKREVFQVYFDGAIQSASAFKILNRADGRVLGCSRYYDYDTKENSILIGYTFFIRECWGKGINREVKNLLLNYIFQYVSKVKFQIGANNIRSQMAITRLGASKIGSEEIAYFGEDTKLNYVYEIRKEDWVGGV